MLQLQMIIGSTRPTRASDLVTPWLERRAREHGAFEVETLDLRDWPLPMFAEHAGSIGDRSDPTYSDPVVKAWNATVKRGDAFLVVTPEYNHSVPGVLKNAIDNVFISYGLRNKPLAAVGYSGGIAGGVRAIEHLAQIAVEAEAAPIRNSVVIPFVGSAFDEDGDPKDANSEIALQIALDDLAWWGEALKRARAEGELPPGMFRARAAAARRQEKAGS
jgi:NAD(P)H-dependent FMN reductase